MIGLVANAATSGVHLAHASAWAVFVVGAVLILAGAFGVILMRNPVHSALMLVVTLFGVAVEFVNQAADFLAAVQIIVYAGAIVILFLFVIMFLGVDRKEAIGSEPFKGQKPLALILGVITLIELLVVSRTSDWTSGYHGFAGDLGVPGDNINKLGQAIYTRYLLPFEMTSALLVIAVVAAVVLSRGQDRAAGELTAAEQAERPDSDGDVGMAAYGDAGVAAEVNEEREVHQ
ncbi:MAG: NADH-quinone oxidoreductase subunit J [Actinomycetota bacterium]|nr:NADH-quinone oxidoreductase subunit J [Actinomycetota bacterium]